MKPQRLTVEERGVLAFYSRIEFFVQYGLIELRELGNGNISIKLSHRAVAELKRRKEGK